MTLGTVQLGLAYGIANTRGKPDRAESELLLAKALELGVNCFDTARIYGDSEEVLGRFFERREKPLFVTKAKLIPEAGWTDADVERVLRESAARSLECLRLPRLPVLMLHNTDILRTHAAGVKSALRALKDEGVIGKAGVSFSADVGDPLPPEWEAALDDIYEAVQLPMNVLDQRLIHSGGLRQMYEAGKIVFVRSIYLQGLLFLDEADMPPELRPAAGPIRTLREVADSEGIGVAQLALSFIRDLPEVDSLVIGADTPGQLADNAALMAGPALSERAVARLRSIPLLPESILNPALWPQKG